MLQLGGDTATETMWSHWLWCHNGSAANWCANPIGR